MSKTLFVILALAIATSFASFEQTACQYIVDDAAVFNLLTVTNQTAVINNNQNITFSLCHGISACANSSLNGSSVTAVLNSNSLITTSPRCENIASTSDPVTSFQDSNNPDLGITFTYPVLDDDSDESILIVNLTCDSSIALAAMTWTVDVSTEIGGPTTYTIQGTGAPGCPLITLERYMAFFNKYRGVFTAVFLIVGVLALLFGFQFFNVTIFILTSIGVAVALFVILFGFAAIKTSYAVEWILLILCCIVGLGCGYGAIKLERVGFFVLGAFLGGLAALFLYSLLLHWTQLSEVVLYVIIVIMALIGGGLSLWLWKDIIILATSCIGAYLTVRGLSFVIGGFPNELAVAEGLETYNYVAYAYMAAIVIVAILGMVFQFKRKRRQEENEKHIGEDTITQERLLRD